MIDLLGEYSHKFDAKGRLTLPTQFRKYLPTDLVVTLDPTGRCLYVFEPSDFNDWVASFFEHADGSGIDPKSTEETDLRRELKARANAVSIDGAGRINVPLNQREAAGIEKDVVLIGNTGYFEIWDAKRREAQRKSVDLTTLMH